MFYLALFRTVYLPQRRVICAVVKDSFIVPRKKIVPTNPYTTTQQAQIVAQYLELRRVFSGRASTKDVEPDNTQSQLEEVLKELANEDMLVVDRLLLLQRKADLEKTLAVEQGKLEYLILEKQFVQVVRDYSLRYSIEFQTWRQMGVPGRVLKAGGLDWPHHPQLIDGDEPLESWNEDEKIKWFELQNSR